MMKPKRKGISKEILNMIETSAREAKVPARDGERMESMNRMRPKQDATRIVPKRIFSDDVPYEHMENRMSKMDYKPIEEYKPRRRR